MAEGAREKGTGTLEGAWSLAGWPQWRRRGNVSECRQREPSPVDPAEALNKITVKHSCCKSFGAGGTCRHVAERDGKRHKLTGTGAKKISPTGAMAQTNRVTCNEGPSPLHSGPRKKDMRGMLWGGAWPGGAGRVRFEVRGC